MLENKIYPRLVSDSILQYSTKKKDSCYHNYVSVCIHVFLKWHASFLLSPVLRYILFFLNTTRKSTQVFDLRSTCVSFGHLQYVHFHRLARLALTYVDFGRAQIRTQVDASFSHDSATQPKSTQVDHKSIVYRHEIYGFLRPAWI